MWNIYVLINKSQLNSDVNSKFSKKCGSILYALLEIFVKSSYESTISDFTRLCRSAYRVSEFFTIFITERKYNKSSSEFSSLTLKKKFKDTRRSLFDNFFYIKTRTQENKLNGCFSNRSTGPRKVQVWVHYFLTLMWLIFYIIWRQWD